MIRLAKAKAAVEKEPLVHPFGFKGGSISELWQSAVLFGGASGGEAVGLGVQSVLWSDPRVFFTLGETEGNAVMYAMTRHALDRAVGSAFASPPELLESVAGPTLEYGKRATGLADLRETFALNALVPFDHAAWMLYCRERGIRSFDDLIPDDYRGAFGYRHAKLAAIPVVSYQHTESDIASMLNEGYFVLKIKLGADPDQDGDPGKMLEWDKRRLETIHRLAADRKTPYTDCGLVVYYLDINGRYERKEQLMRLIDHADRIGALDRIVLVEEPFAEDNKTPVHDVPVRVAADESVHNEREAAERIDLGYGAITLKPIAKTMSVSFKVAKVAGERGVPCFCADLTVNPLMVDWNKNVAARLAPVPGLKVGLIESNGSQNYKNWELMKQYHPRGDAGWVEAKGGIYELDESFYAESGGVFERYVHYERLFADQG